MPEHESYCCLSPLSPCAQKGGCSGSCNCGADESIGDDAAGLTAKMIDDSLRMGLPLELLAQLAYERSASGDA